MKEFWALFDELSKAEITLKSRKLKKEISLLDLLEDDDDELLFNSSESIASFQSKLLALHSNFKKSLGPLNEDNFQERKNFFEEVNFKIAELNLLLNPKVDDLVFARVQIPKHTRLLDDKEKLLFIRKKSAKYIGLQREVLRLTKLTLKPYNKVYLPSKKKAKSKKKKKNQYQLQLDEVSGAGPKWSLEPIKLIELLAALSEVDAFGKRTTRKELWEFFGNQLGVPLENAEKSLSQMKYRKSNPSKFLDELKCEFNELMDR